MAIKDNFPGQAVLTSDPMLQNPAIAQAAERFYALQNAKLEREEREYEEKVLKAKNEALQKEARALENAKREMAEKAEREARQAVCPHLNGATKGISGQGVGGGKILAICQLCQKLYTSWKDIPAHLHPATDTFGGPKNF